MVASCSRANAPCRAVTGEPFMTRLTGELSATSFSIARRISPSVTTPSRRSSSSTTSAISQPALSIRTSTSPSFALGGNNTSRHLRMAAARRTDDFRGISRDDQTIADIVHHDAPGAHDRMRTELQAGENYRAGSDVRVRTDMHLPAEHRAGPDHYIAADCAVVIDARPGVDDHVVLQPDPGLHHGAGHDLHTGAELAPWGERRRGVHHTEELEASPATIGKQFRAPRAVRHHTHPDTEPGCSRIELPQLLIAPQHCDAFHQRTARQRGVDDSLHGQATELQAIEHDTPVSAAAEQIDRAQAT